MSSWIDKDNTIHLTRGDTMNLEIKVNHKDGSPYVPQEGDKCWFSVKKTYNKDEEYLIHKEFDLTTMSLFLESIDTSSMEYGSYKYDIQMNLANGVVDTIIPRSVFILLEEVT